jgi:DNA invertase Pin-like site-specific DNA recombinase
MLQRQREGIAKAKSAGKYKGGEPFAPERRWKVLRLAVEGATKEETNCPSTRPGEAIVYRVLAVARGVVRCVMINA